MLPRRRPGLRPEERPVLRPSAALACMILLAAGAPGAAQQSEILEVPSRSLTDAQFLAGDATAGAPVTLTGRLHLPGTDAPYPAVVLLHGSEGPVSGPVSRWEWTLRPLGIATFSLDSFTARGLTEVATDQSRLPSLTQVYDAYRAADVLAADPRIDPDRIAVMGFSRGGVAALYTAMTRFQQSYGHTRIAAHLPFYPACNSQSPSSPSFRRSSFSEWCSGTSSPASSASGGQRRARAPPPDSAGREEAQGRSIGRGLAGRRLAGTKRWRRWRRSGAGARAVARRPASSATRSRPGASAGGRRPCRHGVQSGRVP